MIFLTGDTHGEFSRFKEKNFPQQFEMTKDDYVIICGDFGGVWCENGSQRKLLDWLEKLPFSILFVTGNHENYDMLEKFPISEWRGGKVQFIRPHVIHLMRGQVFTIEGKKFFTMGGAQCHDMPDGVLDSEDSNYLGKYYSLIQLGAKFRVKGMDWWPQELPSREEYEEAWENLRANNMKVDYIITHCAPTYVQERIIDHFGNDSYPRNELTDFLQEIAEKVEFREWYLGHFHLPMVFGNIKVLEYEIVQLKY